MEGIFLNVTLDFLREHKVLTKVVFLRDKLIDQKGIVQYMHIRAIECPTPKISPGAYIVQRPFLRGLYLEGLMYGGKFAFQNR